jgi:hypothetical protein
MATHKTPQGKKNAAQNAVAYNRLPGILGTARIKAARCGKQWRNAVLVQPDGQYGNAA